MQVILPTCLRDYVPAVHQALLTLLYGLRRLDGQVISQAEAVRLGVVPGSHILNKRSLTRVYKDIIRGLVMLEGSLPACHLNPLLHRFVHYSSQTAMFGCLRWFAMYAFERYNKRIKNLVRNAKTPLASVATNIQLEIGTRFVALADETDDDSVTESERIHNCVFTGRCHMHV